MTMLAPRFVAGATPEGLDGGCVLGHIRYCKRYRHEEVRMFETRGSAAFATMSELKNRAKQTIEKAQERPVYLLRDGEPVGGIVSIEMLEVLQDVLEDRYISDLARQRLQSLREGTDDLLDEDEFWVHADAVMAQRK